MCCVRVKRWEVNHLVAGDSAMEENIFKSHAAHVREEKGWWRNICESKETLKKKINA